MTPPGGDMGIPEGSGGEWSPKAPPVKASDGSSVVKQQRAIPIRRGQTVEAPARLRAGLTLSDAIDLGALSLIGLEVPSLPASLAIFVRVSRSLTGDYFRLQLTDASGDWTIAASTGAKTIFIPDLSPFRFVKWEIDAAQTVDIVGFFIGKL